MLQKSPNKNDRIPESNTVYGCQEKIQNNNSVFDDNISNQSATKTFTSSGNEVKFQVSMKIL